MGFKLKNVELSSIDSGDNTYRITTETCFDDLLDSIKDMGVINPPLLFGKSEYSIVSGFRRIAACRYLGWPTMQARILDSDTKQLDCIKLAITDNTLQRPLNLIETARSLHMLNCVLNDDKRIVKAVSALGLPKNLSIIKKIRKIYDLPQVLQTSILSNTISLSVALELSLMQPGIAETFATLFETLKLSLSKQRELITMIREIAFREDISIPEIFQESYFQNILNDENMDRIQKTNNIRSYLKRRRFPNIASAEKVFEKHVKELKLGNGIKLIPPKDFEGTIYNMMLNFKNSKELKERSGTLSSVIQNPRLEKIIG